MNFSVAAELVLLTKLPLLKSFLFRGLFAFKAMYFVYGTVLGKQATLYHTCIILFHM